MKLILIRHGQTVWNTQMKTQGRTDIMLDEIGRIQSEKLAERVRTLKLRAVYSSPLSRAKETAKLIADLHGLDVISHELLMERDFGAWEGTPFKTLMEKYPDEVKSWEKDPFAYTPPDAEPLSKVLSRCVAFLDEVYKTYTIDDTVLAVGHSIPLRLMIAHSIGLSPLKIHSLRLDNAAYTELKLRENYNILTVFNDTEHLHQQAKITRGAE